MQNKTSNLLADILIGPRKCCCISDREHAVAVTDLFDVIHSQLVKHGQEEIRHGSSARSSQVQIAFELAVGMAEQEYGKLLVLMNIGVTHGTAVHDHRVIE